MMYKPERALTRDQSNLNPIQDSVEMMYKPERALTPDTDRGVVEAPFQVEMMYKPERALTPFII